MEDRAWSGAKPPREEALSDAGAMQAVVERARSGDTAAFAELFRAYERDVGRLCGRMLGADAEDARSEIFLRARRGISSYDPERSFRTWLLSIAGHYCIDQLRRQQTEARLFDASDLQAGDLAGAGPSPLQYLVRREERVALLAAIEALPFKWRLPLVLRHFGELDYGAIAEILGVERGQVGTLLFRARRRLREHLAGSFAGGNGR